MSSTTDDLVHIAEEIVLTYDKFGGINKLDGSNLPTLKHVVEILDDFMHILFPGFFGTQVPARANISFYVQSAIDSLYLRCNDEIFRACDFARKQEQVSPYCLNCSERAALELIRKIPFIRNQLKMEILDGDEVMYTSNRSFSMFVNTDGVDPKGNMPTGHPGVQRKTRYQHLLPSHNYKLRVSRTSGASSKSPIKITYFGSGD